MAQGKWFDYDKEEVAHTEILAPEGTNPTSFVFDRQSLWNAVERSEKRVDAQLCREVELTLPRELTPAARINLVREFVREQFVARGMVADIAIHVPRAADGLEQPHAHVSCTLRRLDPATGTGFSEWKETGWNEAEGVAALVAAARKRFNNTEHPADKAALDAAEAKRNVNVWRAAWAEAANRALEDAGSDARIDHRTLVAQGISRPAQPHLGLARHIEHAYVYLKDRLTHWVAVKKRAALYSDLEYYKTRDSVKVAEFILRLADMAEDFAASFRRPPPDIPEVPLER